MSSRCSMEEYGISTAGLEECDESRALSLDFDTKWQCSDTCSVVSVADAVQS